MKSLKPTAVFALSLLPVFTGLARGATQFDYSRLPLAFEPLPGATQYIARGAGFSVAVRPDGASIRIGKGSGKTTNIRFAGAAAQASANPSDRLPGTVNYFSGSDPHRWRTNVPTYGKVDFAGVYPGVDVTYYGTGSQLEYDFRVQPGSDPSSIHLVFDGPGRPAISSEGDLVVGDVRQHRPAAYQLSVTGRVPVDCRYVIRTRGEVSLALGAYDRRRPVVIDPLLSYSSFLGGSVNDGVTSVKLDAAGNIYMAGFTSSANFPVHSAVQSSYAGVNSPLMQGQFGDAFVAKMSPTGKSLIYATYLGGAGDDFATGLAIDSTGNAYVTGNTQSSNFPTSAGTLQKAYKGIAASDINGFYNPGDGFVAKLDPSGSKLVYSTYLGGSLNDLALGIAVDTAGNAVVVGATNSTDFPTTAGSLYPQFRGNNNFGPFVAGDGFISILNAAGTALNYSTFFGGSGSDGISSVAMDAQNNIYVTGLTLSSDFPVTTGAAQILFHGKPVTNNGFTSTPGDAFVSKLSSKGTLVYSTYLGGAKTDAAAAIAVDAAGAAYVTGATLSADFPATSGAPQSSYKGSGAVGTIGDAYGGDAFVTKLSPDGTAFLYSTYLGGAGDEAGLGIAVDAAGNAFVTGFTLSSDFPKTSNAVQGSNAGFGGQGLAPNPSQGFDTERVRNTGDAFLTELSSSGALVYSSFFGGSKDDAGLAIALDASGNPYIAGNTMSASLPGSSAGAQAAFGGSGQQWPRGDGFLAKFDFGGKVAPAPAHLDVVSGFVGTGAPLAALSTPFVVDVTDATGVALPNVAVSFSATGATVNPSSAMTDAQGHASTVVTLGATAGSGSVTATVTGLPPVTASLAIGATATGPVVKGVVNGASFQPSISPGSWITVYIDQTVPAAATAYQAPLPVTLAGFRILVNGTAIPLYAVAPLSPSGTQLNAQLPYETVVGTAQLAVELGGQQSAAFPITVQTVAPGIFLFGDNRAVVQNVAPDGSLTVNTADNPVPAGDYIIAYLTGQGPLDNPVATGGLASGSPLSKATLTYSATLNGSPTPVAFLGMTPGQIALAQANVQIPRDTQPGPYTLVIQIGSASSNAPTITVTNPRP
jgi:uncharacterized protein (TIGR03437 family)